MTFWFAVRRPKQAGFVAIRFCSLLSVLFPCRGDRRVLAVLRSGLHLWNLAEAFSCLLAAKCFADARMSPACSFSVFRKTHELTA